MRSDHFKRRGIIKAFGTWAVTTYGLETLVAPCDYDINKGMLACVWLRDHMHSKNWVNRVDFDMALRFARQHFGIKAEGGILW